MSLASTDLALDLASLGEVEWLARLEDLGKRHGFSEPLGPRHHALFLGAGPKLLVTFESVRSARRSPGGRPRGFDQVTRQGWSHLALLSRGETFFRDPAVWSRFDRWTDEGFFEGFDTVLFCGTGPGGYAAAAFSVAAPGARVLAFRPLATLDPAVAGWDHRHRQARRRDWTSRYGYAPAMLEAADRAVVLHDPALALDAMHATLFAGPSVTSLRAPFTGRAADAALEGMGLRPLLLELAMEGRLDARAFSVLWRRRRASAAHLRALLRGCERRRHPDLARRVIRWGLRTDDHAFFAGRLARMGPPTQAAQ